MQNMYKIKKIIRNIIAIILFIIGVAGSLIPIFQGWVFVLAGFIVLDFKRKKEYEKKIINIISKTRAGKKLAIFWLKIKNNNKDIIELESNEKIRTIYHDIHRNLKKKDS